VNDFGERRLAGDSDESGGGSGDDESGGGGGSGESGGGSGEDESGGGAGRSGDAGNLGGSLRGCRFPFLPVGRFYAVRRVA
jgi:hypothetical protein